MKNGRSLMELAQELERQRNAKRDYLLDTRNLEMGFVEAGAYQMMMRNDSKNVSTLLGVGEIAHRQIGSALGIPAKYYDKMRAENPELLAQNVNSWFTMTPQKRMVRTLDGNARAFLSERYRRIDNAEIAEAVLPILAEMPDVRIESCEITESKMYLKAVNPRLTAEVVPGDIVQSGWFAPMVWWLTMPERENTMLGAEMKRRRITPCTAVKRWRPMTVRCCSR